MCRLPPVLSAPPLPPPLPPPPSEAHMICTQMPLIFATRRVFALKCHSCGVLAS